MAFAELWRAKLRGFVEGWLQRGSADIHANNAPSDAERWQDYGFAANAVDGEGLVLTIGGHTIVLRMDRSTERPKLAPLEVCLWHKEGHKVTMRAGKVVDVECAVLRVAATTRVEYTTPSFKLNGAEVVAHAHGGAVPPLA